MVKENHSKFNQRINRLHWQVPAAALLLILADQLVEQAWLANASEWGHFASQVFFYGVIGSVTVWWGLTALRRQVDETRAAQRTLQGTQATLIEANQRLEFLGRVSRRLAEADDEEALIDAILDLALEVVPAVGCSLIHFDGRGQPLPAIHRGALDPAIFDAWAAHLAAAENHTRCQDCFASRATASVPCPFTMSLPTATAVGQVHCLALARGNREYGLLNIYTKETQQLDARGQTLLATLANEISVALESQHLRSRELATFHHLQQVRRPGTLQGELVEVLTHTVETLEAIGGALFLVNSETTELELLAQVGHPLGVTQNLVEGLVNSAQSRETPLVINDLEQEENDEHDLPLLLVAPLRGKDQPLGSLVLWGSHPDIFTHRRAQLVAILAGQVALLIEKHRLCAQAEHQAALAERDRLAREIHDGLAQTLGYLKLRTAQIVRWLDVGETRRVKDGVKEIRNLLAEAYVDTREAVDGLRLKPKNGRLSEWLDQVLAEFQSLSGVQVQANTPPELTLPLEVGSQLLRIVQEALSNIRKHARASQTRLEWGTDGLELTLCISDDGRGFDPADVPPISQHGLRIMRERAELLDADLQIISRSGAGTQVVLRLPLTDPKDVRTLSGSTETFQDLATRWER